MSKQASNSGRFFGRRKPKVIEPELFHEERALRPEQSIDDWLEVLRIVQAMPESNEIKMKVQI